jgi:ankyrin repeat protein
MFCKLTFYIIQIIIILIGLSILLINIFTFFRNKMNMKLFAILFFSLPLYTMQRELPPLHAILVDDSMPPLHQAILGSDITSVKTILNVNNVNQLASPQGPTPLYLAAQIGAFDIAELLIKTGADINLSTDTFATPLYIAAQCGQDRIVKLLLKNRAHEEICMKDGTTPLFIAAQYGKISCAEQLLDAGANIDAARTTDSMTPLYIASFYGHDAIVKLLLSRGAKINIKTVAGATPLYAAAQQGHLDIVRLLLERGAAIDAPSNVGVTPLHIAAKNGRLNVVLFLLDKGADINAKETNWGAAFLLLAAYHKHYNVVKKLILRGARLPMQSPMVQEILASTTPAIRDFLTKTYPRLLTLWTSEVARETFEKMTEILTAAEEGRKASDIHLSWLCIEDRLLMALEHIQKKKTPQNIARLFGQSLSNTLKIIRWVEDTLTKNKEFTFDTSGSLIIV